MDHELIAYLDLRFGETKQQIEETRQQISDLRSETRQQIEEVRGEISGLRERTDGQFSDLRSETRQQLEEVRGEISGLRERTDGQFSGLSQQFSSLSQQLASFREETNVRFSRVEEEIRHAHVLIEGQHGDIRLLAEGMSVFTGKLDDLRTELKEEISGVRSLLHTSYRDLDRRVG
jgi:chromosome segregation ATPase